MGDACLKPGRWPGRWDTRVAQGEVSVGPGAGGSCGEREVAHCVPLGIPVVNAVSAADGICDSHGHCGSLPTSRHLVRVGSGRVGAVWFVESPLGLQMKHIALNTESCKNRGLSNAAGAGLSRRVQHPGASLQQKPLHRPRGLQARVGRCFPTQAHSGVAVP